MQQLAGVDALTQAEVESVLQQAVDRAVECDRLSGHSDEVKGVVFSPNGKIIASTSDGRDTIDRVSTTGISSVALLRR